MKFIILLCLPILFSLSVSANNDDPFEHCEQATSNRMYFACQVDVVKKLIQDVTDKKIFNKLMKSVKKECSSSGSARVKVGPKLRMLMALQCEYEALANAYNSMLDEY